MKRSEASFRTAKDLAAGIDKYFTYIEGEYHLDEKDKPVWDREPDPATIAGLALFLGFNSIQDFITYEGSGRFANVLKRGRLRVEWVYEKKLHQQSSAGAIFMLKSMGWDNNNQKKAPGHQAPANLKIQIINTGPKLAGREQDVTL